MNKRMRRFFDIAIHALEYMIAILTIGVLTYLIGLEVYRMFAVDSYVASADHYLTNILTVVVGLEFVRMLINLTPANILEVLIVALARQVIIEHAGAFGTFVYIVCIAGLFAVRRFLVKKEELRQDIGGEGDTEEST